MLKDQKNKKIKGGGQLLPGVQACVLRTDGTSAKFGEPGELLVKGPSAAIGYFNNEKA